MEKRYHRPVAVKKSILVLKSQFQNLTDSEAFLKKRDWDVFSTTNLKEALFYLVKHQPTFMMISTEFPHKKINQLASVLRDLFSVCTVAFSESNSVTSFEFVTQIGAEYHLYPPVTGPAIERILNKFSKDLLNRKGFAEKYTYASARPEIIVDDIYAHLNDQLPTISLVQRGALIALDSVAEKIHPNFPAKQIDHCHEVCAVTIQSEKFSGFLVAATSESHKIETSFMQKIKDKLFGFLASTGEVLNDEEIMELQIRKVPFIEFASKKAEFLKKTIHKDKEVALAFFPTQKIKADFSESYNDEMLAVDVKHIETDKPLEFSLYLHMPANQRSLMYTPKGFPLHKHQKEKFLKLGVSHLHVKRIEFEELNKHHACKFLNDHIQDLYENSSDSAQDFQSVLAKNTDIT